MFRDIFVVAQHANTKFSQFQTWISSGTKLGLRIAVFLSWAATNFASHLPLSRSLFHTHTHTYTQLLSLSLSHSHSFSVSLLLAHPSIIVCLLSSFLPLYLFLSPFFFLSPAQSVSHTRLCIIVLSPFLKSYLSLSLLYSISPSPPFSHTRTHKYDQCFTSSSLCSIFINIQHSN